MLKITKALFLFILIITIFTSCTQNSTNNTTTTASTSTSSASTTAIVSSSTATSSKTTEKATVAATTKKTKATIGVDSNTSSGNTNPDNSFGGKTINPSTNFVPENIFDDVNIWRNSNVGVAITKNSDKAYIKDGNSSLKVVFSERPWSGAMWEASKVRLNLVAGSSYKVSFNVYWPKSYDCAIWWQLYYIAGGLKNVQEYSGKPAGASSGWFKYQKTFVAEEDENYMPIFMVDRMTGGPYTFYLDSFKVEEVFS